MSTPPTAGYRIDVSVIVPVGPSADLRLLAEQLDALRPQLGASNAELILSDNGAGLAAHRELTAAPVRVVDSSDRSGPAHARNVGARAARGSVLAFCDADDVAAADWLLQLEAATAEYDLVGGRLEYLRLNGADRARWNRQTTQALPSKFGYLAFAPSCNFGVRTAVFTAAGGFDETMLYGEDIDLCWRAQRSGARLGWASSAVMHYRLRPELRSMWHQAVRWGRSDAALLRMHQPHGAHRSVVGSFADLVGVLLSALQACCIGWARAKFVFRVGGLAGRLLGSIRERTWAL